MATWSSALGMHRPANCLQLDFVLLGPNPCKSKLHCDDHRCIPIDWCCDTYHDSNCTVRVLPSCCLQLSKCESERKTASVFCVVSPYKRGKNVIASSGGRQFNVFVLFNWFHPVSSSFLWLICLDLERYFKISSGNVFR